MGYIDITFDMVWIKHPPMKEFTEDECELGILLNVHLRIFRGPLTITATEYYN